MVASC